MLTNEKDLSVKVNSQLENFASYRDHLVKNFRPFSKSSLRAGAIFIIGVPLFLYNYYRREQARNYDLDRKYVGKEAKPLPMHSFNLFYPFRQLPQKRQKLDYVKYFEDAEKGPSAYDRALDKLTLGGLALRPVDTNLLKPATYVYNPRTL